MATLRSETNQTEVELELIGYQFPDNHYDEWDSNWLVVSVRVVAPIASWTSKDPCLTTLEVRALANWLADHAAGQRVKSRIYFTEPNLSLEVVRREGDTCDMRFYFAAECLPPGIEVHYDAKDAEDFCIPMRVTTDELRQFANLLCQEVHKFPIRANARLWRPEC